MGLDRVQGNEIVVTQERIARMLGVRREGVTESAFALQRLGLISYARGHIVALDRNGLEQRACECYAVVKREYERLFPETQATRESASSVTSDGRRTPTTKIAVDANAA
jgi:Mn-dependent DtxR family transcriptional regulator